MADEKPKQDTFNYPPLTGKKFLVFQLKFIGVTYEEIAAKTGYSAGYIGNVFKKGGVWYDHYKYWEAEKIKDLEEDTAAEIKKQVVLATAFNKWIMQNRHWYPREGVAVARDILDRAGFKAPEKIEITDPDDHAKKLAAWFEGKGKVPIKNE